MVLLPQFNWNCGFTQLSLPKHALPPNPLSAFGGGLSSKPTRFGFSGIRSLQTVCTTTTVTLSGMLAAMSSRERLQNMHLPSRGCR